MTERAWVVDSWASDFGRHEGHGLVDCAADAVTALLRGCEALAHGGHGLVDGLWVGCARPGESAGWESGLGVRVAQVAGIPGVPATDVRAFCASGNLAFIQAARELQSGRSSVAVAAGVEHMSAYHPSGPLRPVAVPDWADHLSPVTFYGLAASRYLHEYDVSERELADVTVRNREAGTTNPRARFRSPVTVDEVLMSRMIADPLTLLQCSAPADGSGAALLANAAGLERLGLSEEGLAQVVGLGYASSPDSSRVGLVSFGEDASAARTAYEEAGVGPAEVSVAEVHDAFTVAQAIHLEDLGLAERGAGWREARDGLTVNPTGGLLSRGHPLGATGLAQIDGVVSILRRGAGVGLVHEAGGIQHLGQMLSTVILLRREVTG